MVGVRKKRATEGQPETPNETRNRMREREREEIKREINGFARISFYDLGKSSLDHIRRRRLVDEGGRLDSSSYVRCNPMCLLGVFLFPSFCLFLKKRKKEEKILFGATRSFCISMSSRSLKRKQNRNLSLSPATTGKRFFFFFSLGCVIERNNVLLLPRFLFSCAGRKAEEIKGQIEHKKE